MVDENMTVSHVKELEYALMKHIMIHREEKVDVKCVTVIVYAPTVATKTIVCPAVVCRFVNMENEEDDASSVLVQQFVSITRIDKIV